MASELGVDAATLVGHAPGLLVRRTSSSVVALAHAGEPKALREQALDVWDAFLEPGVVGVITEQIARRYGAEPETVETDVLPFVDELVGDGLLVVIERTASPVVDDDLG